MPSRGSNEYVGQPARVPTSYKDRDKDRGDRDGDRDRRYRKDDRAESIAPETEDDDEDESEDDPYPSKIRKQRKDSHDQLYFDDSKDKASRVRSQDTSYDQPVRYKTGGIQPRNTSYDPVDEDDPKYKSSRSRPEYNNVYKEPSNLYRKDSVDDPVDLDDSRYQPSRPRQYTSSRDRVDEGDPKDKSSRSRVYPTTKETTKSYPKGSFDEFQPPIPRDRKARSTGPLDGFHPTTIEFLNENTEEPSSIKDSIKYLVANDILTHLDLDEWRQRARTAVRAGEPETARQLLQQAELIRLYKTGDRRDLSNLVNRKEKALQWYMEQTFSHFKYWVEEAEKDGFSSGQRSRRRFMYKPWARYEKEAWGTDLLEDLPADGNVPKNLPPTDGDNYRVRPGQQLPDSRPRTTSSNLMSPLLTAFVKIHKQEYAECREFCKKNPDIFEEDTGQMQAAALISLKKGEEEYAKQIIERLLILKNAVKYPTKEHRNEYMRKLFLSGEWKRELDANRRRVYQSLEESLSLTPSVGSNRSTPRTRESETKTSIPVRTKESKKR